MNAFEIVTSIEREDGPWWIRCDDKKCDHNAAIATPRSGECRITNAKMGTIEIPLEFLCEKCDGPTHLQRVEINGTIEVDKPKTEDSIEVVNEQAEDEALWTVYPVGQQSIGEAMLQEALRRLHAAVEKKEFKGYKGKYLE